MRRLLPGDLMFGAAYVAASGCSLVVAARLVEEAHAAHSFSKRFGRPHPAWGSGSLMGRVLADGAPEPSSRTLFLDALVLLCLAVQSRTSSTVTRPFDVLTSACSTEQGSWPRQKRR